MNLLELKEFLDEKSNLYENPNFINDDPIQIPHLFRQKEDIEISGFITSVLTWGKRSTTISKSKEIIKLMDDSPYDFVKNHSVKDLESFNHFVHRTFNSQDLKYYIKSLKNIYLNYHGLEKVFSKNHKKNLQLTISSFRDIFFELPNFRTKKHIGNPKNKSAAKKVNMFLRWMVRSNERGVDFGIWKSISPSELSCPLDVHTGKIARKLGLLKRKQNDSLTVNELDEKLRDMDKEDPVKYDFALFGLGIYEKF